MRASLSYIPLSVVFFLLLLLFTPVTTVSSFKSVPLIPDTSMTRDTAMQQSLEDTFVLLISQETLKPHRLRVPSIQLDAPVQPVGLTELGAMDVPDGTSPNVGWYAPGTVPGNIGSAVMDAHVYAAFENLRDAKVGADVYVDMSDGSTVHFEVTDTQVYKLSEVPRELIFARNDDAWLNLITCSGTFQKTLNTYNQRLVVYAKLVE